MSGFPEVQPVEIVRTPINGRELLERTVVAFADRLGAALLLMLAAPRLHEVFGSPAVYPGYWVCLITSLALRGLFPQVLPREAKHALGRKK